MRIRYNVNNLIIIFYFLYRDFRYYNIPEKVLAWDEERIHILEYFGDNGEVPQAWQGLYAELHLRTACASFKCGHKETGYAYLVKAAVLEEMHNWLTYELSWEWLDSVRDEDRFKECVEKASEIKEKYNQPDAGRQINED